jgi:hypothetical protein
MLKQQLFFVYVLQSPESGRIFYVGKAQHGKEKATLWRHLHSPTNPWKRNVIASIIKAGFEPRLVVLRSFLSEATAFALECKLIDTLRGLGVKLTNLTAGGEGTSGFKHTSAVCKIRAERMRSSNPMKNPETAKKLGMSKGKKVLQIKDGCLVAEFVSAAEAERQTGIFQQNITACCRAEKQQASGYVWRYSNGS